MGLKHFVTAACGAALITISSLALAEGGIKPSEEHNIALGGRLYDSWVEISTADDPPMATNPAYPQDKGKARKSKSWSCMSCHGWDYKGKDGQFGKEGDRDFTGIIGVMKAAGRSVKEINEIIAKKHGLDVDKGQIEDDEVEDLALFISKGLVDTSKYIDAKGTATGNAAKGKVFFNTLCSGCHGLDGKLITDMPPLGSVSNENPWRSLHTIRNGRPAQPMPALRTVGDEISGNVLAYIQTLPK